ncbi:GGDEF-domain containing protein [Shewanella sp. NFH-SH190041]|uniref:putative bifunctional diguanylate cyclase/phosphodiesterase n=1 Tax=Shewanella sp. NFH-SH190041 TaxID=2950245 RepID=UPI0021C323D6|nr:EAL domain-containing protein [Shewanella sp. NFH-SH190041]BDM63567.1 GGDEF-domain containing protein [Shewanella sp. NFH-SH190041]
MKFKKWFNSRTAIIIAGLLLTAYLMLILTVTNLGQSRLQASQSHSLTLKVRNYTDNLSLFFDVSQENLTNLTTNRATNTYFSNLAAGMSMEYGLGSSLLQLKQTLWQFLQSKKIDDHPIYRRIVITGFDHQQIADTHPGKAYDLTKLPIATMANIDSRIVVTATQQAPLITLLHTIYHQDQPVAVLAAEINNDVLVHQLSTQEHEINRSCLKLKTPVGDILVWNSLSPAPTAGNNHVSKYHNSNKIFLEQAVTGTPFTLISWFEPLDEQDIFTSAWFIAGISLLALPVLIGLIYLMRINNTNLILQTQIAVSAEQQQALTDKNARLKEEINKRRSSEQKLAFQATHDDLTGLSNRSDGIARLEAALQQAQQNREHIMVMFLDLDNFKQINDTVGHQAGDRLLIDTGGRLQSAIRRTDTVARFGGDEFLVIIPDIKNHTNATQLAEDILHLFERPFHIGDQEFFVSTSIGLAMYPKDGNDVFHLLKNADTALYRAKESGRNGYCWYDISMNHDTQRKLALDVRLHQAIGTEQIQVFYQPIVDLSSQKIIGAEALLRWFDDELGFIPPDEFIPLAEKNGLIHKLGDQVFEQACQQAAQWQALGPFTLAVNFSSVQFRYCEKLQHRILEVLAITGLPAQRLNIEVTESLLIDQDDTLMATLSYLKQLGVGLSIDDFGTGYSALSYLQKFAFSKLKIDRSFINRMAKNEADKSLVTAILAMAKALGLKVVAEGIEVPHEAAFLAQHGCEYGQGYLFSRPLTAKALTEKLQRQQPTLSSQPKALA